MTWKVARIATPLVRRLSGLALSLALTLSYSLSLGTLPAGLAEEALALYQQGPKLTAGDELGSGSFGRSAALSADGATALIGGPRDGSEAGAAWVFTRSGSTWVQQAKLTGMGEEAGEAHFARSVALSAAGNTALIGAPNDNDVGTAWVFTRSGSTWTEQAQLTGAGESGGGWFGRSVALSADGDTALVGGFVDHSDVGAAWVFVRSGSSWVQQGPKLTGAEESGAGEFGWSVALSGDGDTALVGGHEDGGGVGAAWVFARSGSSWAQQGPKLAGGEESGAGTFGQAVALSGDGDTALVGGHEDGGGVGAAWVFARSGSSWVQQGPKLKASDESGAGFFGAAVSLTRDGSMALIGALNDDAGRGAAWVFRHSGAGWSQAGPKLTGGEEVGRGQFGWSTALSALGETALVGGISDSGRAGAAWAFGPQPPAPSGGGEPTGGGSAGGGPDLPASPRSSPGTSAAGAPTAQQGVAGFRAAGGTVVLVSRRVRVRDGRAAVGLRCTAPGGCAGRLVLAVLRRTRLAAQSRRLSTIAGGRYSIPRGRVVRVTLRLNALGRARLGAGRGRLRASLAIGPAAPSPAQTHAYVVELVRMRARRSR